MTSLGHRRRRQVGLRRPDAAAAESGDGWAAYLADLGERGLSVSQAEAIERFAVLDEDFTEAGGLLTPMLKMRRHVIMEQYEAQIAALCDDDPCLVGGASLGPVRQRRAGGG